jgi:hypothetical protein
MVPHKEKERSHGGQRKVGMADPQQRLCVLVFQPRRSMVSRESMAVTPPSVEAKRTRGHPTDPDDLGCCRAGDSLVGAPVGHGKELVVREGMLLVATIGMPERLLDLCCSFGPNFRCCWRSEKTLPEGKTSSCLR